MEALARAGTVTKAEDGEPTLTGVATLLPDFLSWAAPAVSWAAPALGLSEILQPLPPHDRSRSGSSPARPR